MSQKQQALKKLAKAAYIIAKVTRIIMFVAIGVMFSSLFFLLLSGSEQHLDVGAITIYSGILADIEMGFEETTCLLSSAIAYAIIIVVILYHLGAIFKSIAGNGSPFELNNISRLKKSAISVALLSIIPAIIEASVAAALGTAGRIGVFFDGAFIILAFFFFCLAYIFEYGAELQKQSDETL